MTPWPSLVALTFDWTISLSDVMVASSAIVSTWSAVFFMWHRIDRRIGSAEQTLEERVLPALDEHTRAMKDHDNKISALMTQVAVAMAVAGIVKRPDMDPDRFPR